jgi:tetrahydromethanopterin S-methyltransferase subunit A
MYMTAINRCLIFRVDHAAYLGRELARAEITPTSGDWYVQDATPEAEKTGICVCMDATALADGPAKGQGEPMVL